MLKNQLEFSGNKNDYFIYRNAEENINGNSNKDYNKYIDDFNNYEIEGHINNEVYAEKYAPTFEEKLEYRIQNDIDIFPLQKPIALIYDSTKTNNLEKRNRNRSNHNSYKKNNSKKINFNSNIGKNVKSTFKNINKTKKIIPIEKPNNIKNNLSSFNTSSNPKGLFDPILKTNELDMNRRTQVQRQERIEKIKNYNMKFGNKVKNIQFYNNYMDLVEDITNKKSEREFNKTYKNKSRSMNKIHNKASSFGYKNSASIADVLAKIPVPKYDYNNLDFNFSKHDQVIKSLEDQIEYERKMRADTNMKYVQKVKEWEELKFNILAHGKRSASNTTSTKKIYINKRAKQVINRYSNLKYAGKNSLQTTKFKKDLNRSVDLIKKSFPANVFKHFRTNSVDNIKEKMKNLSPLIDNLVEYSVNNLYKDILRKNKKTLGNERMRNQSANKKSQSSRSLSSRQRINNGQISNPLNINSNMSNESHSLKNLNNNYMTEEINQDTKEENLNILYSPIQNQNTNLNLFSTNKSNNFISSPINIGTSYTSQHNNNPNKNLVYLNSTNIETKLANEILSQQNLEKFQNMNKLEMVSTLNKEIDRYNRGIPQLINKVESVIEKINKTNIFDENSMHPIIQMASKHSGHVVHLHVEKIVDGIIDDLMYECVDELQRIEDCNNKKYDRDQFKTFICDYYSNFELMRNLETDVSKKLSSKNYVSHNEILKVKEEQAISAKNLYERKEIIYKNPFEFGLETLRNDPSLNSNKLNYNLYSNPELFFMKQSYSAKINQNLLISCEKYSKNFFEYLKTTGSFYFPNIFVIYDEVVKEVLEDLLEIELNYCIKQLDSFAVEIYKEEVFNNDFIK